MDLRSALELMLSPNNQQRKSAEDFYNSLLSSSPAATIQSLLSLYPQSPSQQKILTIILLKHVIDPLSSREIYSSMPSPDKSTINLTLLHLLQSESDLKPSSMLSELIGSLTSNIYSHKQDWQDLITFLQSSLNSLHPFSFDLLSCTFIYIHKHFELTPALFINYFSLEPYQTKLKVLKLLNSLLSVYQKVKTLPYCKIIPVVLQSVFQIISFEEFLGNQALELLREIIENRGFLFEEHLQVLLEFQSSAFQLALTEASRFLILDCLVTLYETSSAVQFEPSLGIIKTIMSEMIRSEEDSTCDSSNLEIDYSITGRKQINRMVEALGEEKLMPAVLEIIHKGLVQEDWRGQYASIVLLGELINFIAEPNKIAELIPIVNSACCSSVNKLRYAGFILITDLSVNYIQEFQATYHKQIFPVILTGCHDSVLPVRKQALLSATGFIEGAGYKISSLYTQSLPYFLTLLHTQDSEIIESAVKVVSAFGKSAKVSLSSYYKQIVEDLLALLSRLPSSYLLVKARVIESLSLCSSAVGKQLFVTKLSDIISAISTFDALPGDESLIYVFNAWENICELLQEDFSEYMDYIVPFLLRFLSSPDEGVNVNTAEVINKENALQCICKIVEVLKGRYLKYLGDTLRVALPLINYTLNDTLRSSSADLLPGLIQVKKSGNEVNSFQHSLDLGRVFIDLLIKAISEEFNKEALQSQLESISSILSTLNSPFLTQEKINELSALVLNIYQKRSEKFSDFDDKFLIFALSDVVGAIFKTHPYLTSALLSRLSAELIPNLLKSDEKVLQRSVIYILDDAIEYLGKAFPNNKWDEIVSIILCYAADPDDETRQAAVYGLGMYATISTDFTNKSCIILNALWDSLNVESKRIKTRNLARDNSISAIGKIIKFQSSFIDLNCIEKWINALPLRWDKEEAVFCHGLLADILENSPHLAVSGDQSRFIWIVKIISAVTDSKLSDQETSSKFRRFLNRNLEHVEKIAGEVDEAVREKLRTILKGD